MKKAFTLIELLIVIAIIGILTVVSLSSYSSTRQVAEINIQTDTLVTLLRESKGKAQNTTPDEEGKLYCIGFQFSQNSVDTDTPQIQKIKVPYKNQFEPCDTEQEPIPEPGLEDIELEITKINLNEGADSKEVNQLSILYFPPKGEFKIYDGATVNNNFKTITIETKLKDKINNNLIQISDSGLIQKTRLENDPAGNET
jgi:prepilin-type N-terminal cleavage/methylation domain-containing protein